MINLRCLYGWNFGLYLEFRGTFIFIYFGFPQILPKLTEILMSSNMLRHS